MVYICMSDKELSDDDMGHLATTLGCTVGYIGKVVHRDRWDYKLEADPLTDGQKEFVSRCGLEIYAGPDIMPP